MKKIEQETNSSAVLEIFHINEDVICQHLDEGLGQGGSTRVKNKLKIEKIRSFALENPKKYIEAIKSIALEEKKHSLIFKIFPGHIKEEKKINELFSTCSSLFFLRRNSLQSYISNKKAIKVGTYANINTSHIKVDFEGGEFMAWRSNIYNFFNTVETIAKNNGINIKYYNYEDIYSNDKKFISKLYSHIGLSLNKIKNPEPTLKKQDHSPNAITKVSNPEALLDFLKEKELLALNPSFNSDIYN